MKKIRIFISSVQKEFADERQQLFTYLIRDPLLGLFFEPFLFENLPASDQRTDAVYISEVARCDVYIGLFGSDYGFEDTDGFSPTEREFDEATVQHRTRLIFVKGDALIQRHPKMAKLIKKAGDGLIRKRFINSVELLSGIYASLVCYLREKEIIRTAPFDATCHPTAGIIDLDTNKIKEFVRIARAKRGFPLPAESSTEVILTHLNLIDGGRISNAAILLFGKQPQRFFISSEIKCAHFHGLDIVKPIPAYQVYKGDVFQLVNQVVDFILSKIAVSVGTRDEGTQVPVNYELPPAAVSEAIVNAIAHRDYTSNASIQVMLFENRLEIWNPGQLPLGLNTAKLRQPHTSIPANPLLAEPMYLAGYIERLGTGTGDIIRLCNELNLKEPDFIQDDIFKVIIWRTKNITPDNEVSGEVSGEAGGEVSREVSDKIKRVVLVIEREIKRVDIQHKLNIESDDYFRVNYIKPALENGYIELTHPNSPNHPQQRYRLSVKGLALKQMLQNKRTKK